MISLQGPPGLELRFVQTVNDEEPGKYRTSMGFFEVVSEKVQVST